MSKKIWMTLVSIITVTLMVATSVEAAIGTSSYVGDAKKEVKIEPTPAVYADSGRIGLSQAAKIDTKSEIKPAEPVPSVDVTAKIDAKSKIKSDESVTPTNDPTKVDSSVKVSIETKDVPTGNGSHNPDNDLIWLVIQGDEVSHNNSETPNIGSNGSEVLSANNQGATIAGSPGSSPVKVDEVFVASSSGLVDKIVSIDTTLPLNILGYAKIDVLSGSENLNAGPYFEGLDIFDKLSLAAASTLMMFLVRAIQLLDIAFPLVDAIKIATKICALILEGAIYVIQNGLILSTQIINISISITIGDHTYTLTNPIRNAIINLLNPILNILNDIVTSLDVEQSVSNIINYFQNLTTLFEKTDFRVLVKQLVSSSSLAVYAILQVLQRKNTSQIEAYFEQIGLSHSVAQTLVSSLNFYDGLFVSIRDGIFGKFDAFITYGRDATALRNIHVEVNPNCQVVAGQYAAIIQIKAISAGQTFDTKTIGILYDGGGDVPSLGESAGVIATNNVMEGMNGQAQGYNQGATNI